MEHTPTILIVDDDRDIRELLAGYLQKNGLQTQVAADGRAMWIVLAAQPIDLVVLDVMLPQEDGLSLCRKLREKGNLPIIMLTARGDELDRILGLEMGADDYLPKPFVPRELLARINSVLRRTHALPPNLQPAVVRYYQFGQWILDTTARHLRGEDGCIVALSGAEYRLLEVFLQHPQRVLSRDQLSQFTQGRESDPFDRAIDLQVSRLRQRLGDDGRNPQLLKTVRSEGYVLAVDVSGR